MNRKEALAKVSDHVAGWLAGATFEEATGVDEDISFADEERLGWAVAEVARRLGQMGGAR